MPTSTHTALRTALGVVVFVTAGVGLVVPSISAAEQADTPTPVTFMKDIAPILQRSCQNCHQPN